MNDLRVELEKRAKEIEKKINRIEADLEEKDYYNGSDYYFRIEGKERENLNKEYNRLSYEFDEVNNQLNKLIENEKKELQKFKDAYKYSGLYITNNVGYDMEIWLKEKIEKTLDFSEIVGLCGIKDKNQVVKIVIEKDTKIDITDDFDVKCIEISGYYDENGKIIYTKDPDYTYSF